VGRKVYAALCLTVETSCRNALTVIGDALAPPTIQAAYAWPILADEPLLLMTELF
jgi:hypothetical protein